MKMQLKVVSIYMLLVAVVLGYDEKYDKIDVDKILTDETLLMSYLNCFLDKEECTAEYASDYKGMIPEVLSTTCGKCTKIQKQYFKKVLKELYKNKLDVLLQIQKKYDPKGEYEENIKKLMDEDS